MVAKSPASEDPAAATNWSGRIRTQLAAAAMVARRPLDRLRGRRSAALTGSPAPELAPASDDAQGVQAAAPDPPPIELRRTAKRARLLLLIIVALAQVMVAVISWRIKEWRARRR
jgi:hypothetical protein